MKTKQIILQTVALSLGMAMLAGPAQAFDHYWVGTGTSWWDFAANWAATEGGTGGVGQPIAGDNVYLTTTTDYTEKIIRYLNSTQPTPILNKLVIDATGYVGYGTTITTLEQTSVAASSMSAVNEYIGLDGQGSYVQSTGTNTVTNSLYLGYSAGSYGGYVLSGGSLSADEEYLGLNGNGDFLQSGGTNTVANNLSLGLGDGASGQYYLSGGTLNVGGDILGGPDRNSSSYLYIDGGVLNVAGGDIKVNAFVFGYESGTNGSHTLSGTDTITVGVEYIGYAGSGSLTQTGGTHTIATDLLLALDYNVSGTYTLSGGTLNVGTDIITGAGTSRLNINGGALNVAGGDIEVSKLILGSTAIANGTHTMSGTETITVDSQIIGDFGTGALTQTGGTNTVMNDLVFGANASGNGTYTLSGGTLNVGWDITTGSGTSRLNINGGALNVAGGDITVDSLYFASVAGSNGNHTLSGTDTITVGDEYIGYAGSGSLTQTGGTHWVTNLVIGNAPGSSGSYVITDGTLTTEDSFQNNDYFSIGASAKATADGGGMENQGSMRLEGLLTGNGALKNYGSIDGGGAIAGSGGFTNYGSLATDSGFVLSNSGANNNYGNLDLATSGQLRLTGATLSNKGALNLNNGLVTGTGSLQNSYGGTISGRGTIATSFNNAGGVLLVESGATNITKPFANSGVVQMAGLDATLGGGTMENLGTVEGYGHVGNNIKNGGTIRANNGALTLSGSVDNGAAPCRSWATPPC